METLKSVLSKLSKTLAPPDEMDEDQLFEFSLYDFHDVLKERSLADFEVTEVQSLSPKKRKQFFALLHLHTIIKLYATVDNGGVLSVFYNRTGRELEQLLVTLKNIKEPILPFVEEAYTLLEPVYRFQTNTNFASNRGDASPFDVSDSVRTRVKAIEVLLEEHRDASIARVIETYRDAYN